MLYQLVRPMRRVDSRIPQFVKRIPADLRGRLAGRRLEIPLGSKTKTILIGAKVDAIRFSLETADPADAKIRQAEILAYLEARFQAIRENRPVTLTRRQAVALSKEIYLAWAVSPVIDRVLARHDIFSVDAGSRELLFEAFLLALKDAFAIRSKRMASDYTPDPKAQRFPEWEPPKAVEHAPAVPKASLKGLVENWWTEAKATGLKPSTYESYRNTMARFTAFVEDDDASKVTPEWPAAGFVDTHLS